MPNEHIIISISAAGAHMRRNKRFSEPSWASSIEYVTLVRRAGMRYSNMLHGGGGRAINFCYVTQNPIFLKKVYRFTNTRWLYFLKGVDLFIAINPQILNEEIYYLHKFIHTRSVLNELRLDLSFAYRYVAIYYLFIIIICLFVQKSIRIEYLIVF